MIDDFTLAPWPSGYGDEHFWFCNYDGRVSNGAATLLPAIFCRLAGGIILNHGLYHSHSRAYSTRAAAMAALRAVMGEDYVGI